VSEARNREAAITVEVEALRWPGPALLGAVLSRSTGKDSRIHDPDHWAGVAAAGLALLDRTPGADPDVVLAFALLHDAMRESDGYDPHHGARGAALARELHAAGALELDDARLGLLVEACTYHDKGGVSTDPTIGTCFDADRLNLRRVGRKPNPALLSTPAGRRAADAHWPKVVSAVRLDWRPIFLGYDAKRAGAGAYLRFGDLPPGGRSGVFWGMGHEAGSRSTRPPGGGWTAPTSWTSAGSCSASTPGT